MGFSHIASASGYYDGIDSLPTLQCSASLNVAKGDLLVCAVEWYLEAPTISSIADTDGTNPFTLMAENRNAGTFKVLQIGYKIAAEADDSFTCKVTWSGNSQYKSLNVYQFRPSLGREVFLDTYAITKQAGAAVDKTTDAITTTGDDEVVVVSLSIYNYYNYATPTLGGGNVDGQIQAPVGANGLGELAYSIFNQVKTGIYATWAGGSSEGYSAQIVSFKASVRVIPGYQILKSNNPLIAMRRGGR